MADGFFTEQETRTPLALTKAELAAGRAKAIAMWNDVDVDGDKAGLAISAGSATVAGIPDAVPVSMVESAAYAFAIIAAAARIDSQNANVQAVGIEGDIAQAIPSALPVALQIVRDYAKWVVETKTLHAIRKLDL